MAIQSIAVWVATVFLSLVFLFFSSIKILGWHKSIYPFQLEMVTRYGLNRQLFAMVGLIELFGAIAILWNGNWLGALGALAILITSAGAIACHLIFDRGKYIVPSLVTFTLSAFVFAYNWPHLQPLLPV